MDVLQQQNARLPHPCEALGSVSRNENNKQNTQNKTNKQKTNKQAEIKQTNRKETSLGPFRNVEEDRKKQYEAVCTLVGIVGRHWASPWTSSSDFEFLDLTGCLSHTDLSDNLMNTANETSSLGSLPERAPACVPRAAWSFSNWHM